MIANLKTAGALGLTIPKRVLLRADEVIERSPAPSLRPWLRPACCTPSQPTRCRASDSSAGLVRYPKFIESFEQGLDELGYVNGKNITIEHRSEGSPAELTPVSLPNSSGAASPCSWSARHVARSRSGTRRSGFRS